jgi:hypothetical protein
LQQCIDCHLALAAGTTLDDIIFDRFSIMFKLFECWRWSLTPQFNLDIGQRSKPNPALNWSSRRELMIFNGESATVEAYPLAAIGIWPYIQVHNGHAAELVFIESQLCPAQSITLKLSI